jgi:hypothetical protein
MNLCYGDNTGIKISLHALLEIDADRTKSVPTGTVIKADFVGEVHFDNSQETRQQLTQSAVSAMVVQSSVAVMVKNAFTGTHFWELVICFRGHDILKDINEMCKSRWPTLPLLASRILCKHATSLVHPVPGQSFDFTP